MKHACPLPFFQRVMYDISYHNHSCKRIPLRVHFHPMEVPREAKLLSEVVLGSSSAPGQGLLVNIWVGNVSETGGKEDDDVIKGRTPIK